MQLVNILVGNERLDEVIVKEMRNVTAQESAATEQLAARTCEPEAESVPVDPLVRVLQRVIAATPLPSSLRSTLLRLVCFASVGAAGALLKLATMYLLTDLAGFHYLLSYVLSFVLVVTHNYLLNSQWTFRTSGSAQGLGRYALVSSFSALLKMALVFVLTELAGLWYLASTAISILAGFVASYGLSLRWVWTTRVGTSRGAR